MHSAIASRKMPDENAYCRNYNQMKWAFQMHTEMTLWSMSSPCRSADVAGDDEMEHQRFWNNICAAQFTRHGSKAILLFVHFLFVMSFTSILISVIVSNIIFDIFSLLHALLLSRKAHTVASTTAV